MEKKSKRVMIAAKVPVEIREAVEQIAQEEDRTVSNVVLRLLSAHPLLAARIKPLSAEPVSNSQI